MDSVRILLHFLFISATISTDFAQSIIKISPENPTPNHIYLISAGDNRKIRREDSLYCHSWSFSIETNDAGSWTQIPERCADFVKNYMKEDGYVSDSDMVGQNSLQFAKTVEIAGDGKDVWIFDIDETLLSNLPYYAAHGYGGDIFDDAAFDEWVALAESPALPASLKLYKELQRLGFTVVLLTGRGEYQRNFTVKNLLSAGYTDWERLILREPDDSNTTAVAYKSEKRMQLEAEGYRVHGNSGDQWSDLMGSPMARRSFKLPNPMYYIA